MSTKKNYALTWMDASAAVAGMAIRAKAPIYGAIIRPGQGKASLDKVALHAMGDTSYYEGRWVEASLILNHPQMAEPLEMKEVIVKMVMTKNVVHTTVQGLSGTIKEYICDGDWEITISGQVVAVDPYSLQTVDEYPEEGVKDLIEICSINEAIQVGGYFMDMFKVSRIVVKRLEIDQQTYSNSQEFKITAVSDMDYVIKEEKY